MRPEDEDHSPVRDAGIDAALALSTPVSHVRIGAAMDLGDRRGNPSRRTVALMLLVVRVERSRGRRKGRKLASDGIITRNRVYKPSADGHARGVDTRTLDAIVLSQVDEQIPDEL